MINVYIYKEKGIAYRFKIKGHSTYSEHGKDIVCSAVSVLAQTILMTLNNVYGGYDCTFHSRDGYLEAIVPGDGNFKEVQILFKALELGIAAIENEYPEHVKLNC